MYKLYWNDNSGAFVVHAALKEAGANYVIVEVDVANNEHKSADFLEINPMGQVPALLLPDGAVITETAAAVLHIADAFPESKLMPETASTSRALAYRWLIYMATNVYPGVLRFYYSDRFVDNAEYSQSVEAKARIELESNFDLLDAVLNDQRYLAGDEITIVDTYLMMVVMWHWDLSSLLKRCKNISRVITEVRNRPAIEKIWDQNFPDGPQI